MTKKLVILSIVQLGMLLSLTTHGQKRQDKQNLKFYSKSPKLFAATGWKQNETTGKWIANKNVIYDSKCSPLWTSHVEENFTWIQFATIKRNGKTLYVLLHERLAGEYKYPSIQQGWVSDLKTNFAVYDSSEYVKLKAGINDPSGNVAIVNSDFFGYTTNRFQALGGEHLYNESNLLAKITVALEDSSFIGTFRNDCFMLKYQEIDGEDLIRFRLRGEYCDEKALSQAYFEVKKTAFKQILID